MIGRNMQEIIPYMAIVIHLFEFVSIIIVYNQLIDRLFLCRENSVVIEN